jgi:two-component sensor histidine kinase
LYIDDDAALRRLVQRTLERVGYAVTLAGDGTEGVEMAKAAAFDVIAVDHHMPAMDGLTTLKTLRARPDCPPVVYVTGADDGRLAVAALKAGADDYVVKTVGEDFTELLRTTFAQTLERVALRREKEEADRRLIASNERLESLLHEVNHRVANNLQMAMSFIGMQASLLPVGEARDALLSTQQRIGAIAQVNRHLYSTGGVETVAMADYLAKLSAELAETWSTPAGPRRIVACTEDIELATDRAVTLGIVICELVGNACKYAYAPDAAGDVRIELVRLNGDRLVLSVSDDGVGLGDGEGPKGTGLGRRLVQAMARGLGADVRVQSGAGVRFEMEFGVA